MLTGKIEESHGRQQIGFQIVDWIVGDKLPVRFQLQMHKFIWDPKQKGV